MFDDTHLGPDSLSGRHISTSVSCCSTREAVLTSWHDTSHYPCVRGLSLQKWPCNC